MVRQICPPCMHEPSADELCSLFNKWLVAVTWRKFVTSVSTSIDSIFSVPVRRIYYLWYILWPGMVSKFLRAEPFCPLTTDTSVWINGTLISLAVEGAWVYANTRKHFLISSSEAWGRGRGLKPLHFQKIHISPPDFAYLAIIKSSSTSIIMNSCYYIAS